MSDRNAEPRGTALIDTAGLVTQAAARRAGAMVAAAGDDRQHAGSVARDFLSALPDPAAPRPAAGSDPGDAVQRQAIVQAWAAHIDRLRQAYAAGYQAGRDAAVRSAA